MKKLFALVWTLFMCLSLAACGNTESDDTQSGYETVMDMEFLDGDVEHRRHREVIL